jgi:hypothetical protein
LNDVVGHSAKEEETYGDISAVAKLYDKVKASNSKQQRQKSNAHNQTIGLN